MSADRVEFRLGISRQSERMASIQRNSKAVLWFRRRSNIKAVIRQMFPVKVEL